MVLSSVFPFSLPKNAAAAESPCANVYWQSLNQNDLTKSISQILVLPNNSILCISNGKIVKSVNGGSSFIPSDYGIREKIRKVFCPETDYMHFRETRSMNQPIWEQYGQKDFY